MKAEQGNRISSFSRRIFLKRVGVACLGLPPFLQACNLLSNEPSFKEGKMEKGILTQTERGSRVQKPLIDAHQPNQTEMATFALG